MLREVSRRACSNCCAFEDQACMNLVTFLSESGQRRAPMPGDVCPEHMTQDEHRSETALIEEGRENAGIEGAHAASQAWRAGCKLIAALAQRLNGGSK